MKGAYGVVAKNKIIAYHKKYEVVENYCEYISNHYDITSDIVKIPKSTKIHEYDDLYLVRYGDSYIQLKYYEVAQEQDEELLYDLNITKDVLLRTLEFTEDKKERKNIEKTLSVIERQISRIKSESADPNTLEHLYQLKMSYMNAMYE